MILNLLAVKYSYPLNRLWRPVGLFDVKDLTLSSPSDHRWQWGGQPHTLAALYSPEVFFVCLSLWYSFMLEAESIVAGKIRETDKNNSCHWVLNL
jgi:hypothetical protein